MHLAAHFSSAYDLIPPAARLRDGETRTFTLTLRHFQHSGRLLVDAPWLGSEHDEVGGGKLSEGGSGQSVLCKAVCAGGGRCGSRTTNVNGYCRIASHQAQAAESKLVEQMVTYHLRQRWAARWDMAAQNAAISAAARGRWLEPTLMGFVLRSDPQKVAADWDAGRLV